MSDNDAAAYRPATDMGSIDGLERELAAAHDRIASLRSELSELSEAHAELKDAESRQRAVAHDAQHRVLNMLSVIRSICRRTRESGASPEEFADHFEGRLNAVARSQVGMGSFGASGIDLEDLLRDELLAVGCTDGPRCIIDGPPVCLRQEPAELMGLAIHELATNSIKFGALTGGGSLAVRWSVDEGRTGPLLRFAWTETGVAVAAAAPRPSGFGRQLIEQAIPYQLGAETAFCLKPGGVDCEIRLPIAADSLLAEDDGADGLLSPCAGTE